MFLCYSELFVFNTDAQAVTSGEYVNINESDQRDLEGLYKICHNFRTKDPNYTEQNSCRS